MRSLLYIAAACCLFFYGSTTESEAFDIESRESVVTVLDAADENIELIVPALLMLAWVLVRRRDRRADMGGGPA